ncbi:hypothetical protein [Streptomyces sp. GbtcB6]|uniref:hypothetical protein n=1 Tax=Streptomyces sp. GbtcB6 TaxID=2824751 RepID=UPI001C2F1686|nr:hypothetical protein [Streptomyces sp. GbtcB6]
MRTTSGIPAVAGVVTAARPALAVDRQSRFSVNANGRAAEGGPYAGDRGRLR